ncbi:MAG TPA: ferritin [Candidatus Krumholzibacteria bacterium]|nr:ferritin [Candidatus Krumholzibacteria bacterium]
MISKKMEAAINKQINLEIESALLYLQMSAHFAQENLNGFSHWMRIQHQEELMHANRLFDYVLQRDGDVTLTAVAAPPKTWKTTLAACEAAYKAEVNNTKQINALMDQAIKENDHATRVILEWFVEEQVEEESSALNLIKQVQLAAKSAGAILLLDRELAGRQATPPGTTQA